MPLAEEEIVEEEAGEVVNVRDKSLQDDSKDTLTADDVGSIQ